MSESLHVGNNLDTVTDGRGTVVAQCFVSENHPAPNELARLIAAAPDLLAALERLLADEGLHSVGCKEFPPGFAHLEKTCCPVKVARAAIAKAKGQA